MLDRIKDKLLILDIDETLIHTEMLPKPLDKEYGCDFSMDLDDNYIYYTFKRPHVEKFLNWALENWKVAIFTTATADYVVEIMRNLSVDLSKFEFLYDRNYCNTKYDFDGPHSGSRHWVKKLDRVRRSFDFPLEKMLIVDDKPETASENYGNLIQIKPFYSDQNDVELLKLMSYLEKIKDAENFRDIEKRGWSDNQEIIL